MDVATHHRERERGVAKSERADTFMKRYANHPFERERKSKREEEKVKQTESKWKGK
jgi:hypothetical protein